MAITSLAYISVNIQGNSMEWSVTSKVYRDSMHKKSSVSVATRLRSTKVHFKHALEDQHKKGEGRGAFLEVVESNRQETSRTS